jgi:hypothetical protein
MRMHHHALPLMQTHAIEIQPLIRRAPSRSFNLLGINLIAGVTPHRQGVLKNADMVDPEAYEAYLRGRHFGNKRTVDGLKKERLIISLRRSKKIRATLTLTLP